mmetsp:Transcript_28158/g.81091  ORF Transcript_28158/g.81091 Transcript_28158/m.81091 type:complete len:108 (+) Transcript_28158:539-862(+)
MCRSGINTFGVGVQQIIEPPPMDSRQPCALCCTNEASAAGGSLLPVCPGALGYPEMQCSDRDDLPACDFSDAVGRGGRKSTGGKQSAVAAGDDGQEQQGKSGDGTDK